MSEEQGTRYSLQRGAPSRLGLALLVGAVVGSGLMYLLDPRTGNRRRAIARDKAVHIFKRSSTVAGKTFRHLSNKLGGAVSVLAGQLRPEGTISDRKLEERIRSIVGRSIPHPGTVDFAVHDGRVIVRGYLRPHEAGQLVQAVESVHGVKSVDNQIVDSAPGQQPIQ